MSVETLIERYGRTYTLRRFAPGGGYSAIGKWVPGPEVFGPDGAPLTVLGSAQPLGTMENLVLAEGDRQRDAQRFYTLDRLNVANQETGQAADIIVLDSGEFVVFKEAVFASVASPEEPLPHYKYIVLRAMKDKEA